MKVSLVVQTAGKSSGQTIPITLSQFVIGRDPQCNLRPASAVISKRHCALIIRNGKLHIRDFDSTNGTFVNDEQVKGEREVKHDDTLKIGPLGFRVVIETTTPVNKPTPVPPKAGAGSDDESVAAMLLSLQEEGAVDDSPAIPDSGEIPGGSTVMDMMPVGDALAAAKEEAQKAGAEPAQQKEEQKPEPEAKKPEDKKKQEKANTSLAAKAILEKYTRRQRG